ncbi:MAG: pirin family protein [Blastocatellia bacterium]
MQIIRAADRFHMDGGWLSAYWLFSFDRYYDPNNMSFGPLRVFNHDTIHGGGGFPTHSHREMEIITYVLDGELAHKDSTGGEGVIHAGEVQRMTAGTGIAHSEFNLSETDSLRLMQMWVLPARPGLTPSYEQKQFTPAQRHGRLLPIASGQDRPDVVRVNQDVTFYVSALEPGATVRHDLQPGRRAFLYVIEGGVQVNGEALAGGDQARLIADQQTITLAIEATTKTELILIDMI